MNAEIHSKDQEKESSPGKTHRVYSDAFRVSRLGGLLILTAEENDYSPSNDHPFEPTLPKDITRTFRLSLTAEEVKQIVDVAISSELIHPEIVVTAKSKKR